MTPPALSRRIFLRSLLVAVPSVAFFDIGAAYRSRTLNFHPDAFKFLMEPCPGLFNPPAKGLGISVRFIKEYDILSSETPSRLDVLYGCGEIVVPDLAVKVTER